MLYSSSAISPREGTMAKFFGDLLRLSTIPEIWLAFTLITLAIIGIVYLFVGLISFLRLLLASRRNPTLKQFSIRAIFIPITSMLLGILLSFVQVALLGLVIAGIYASVGYPMSVFELLADVVLVAFVILYFSFGRVSNLYSM